jgi:hypothetical protein
MNASAAGVSIIAAGSSSVAVAKALKHRGVAFDCFEKGSQLDGIWRYVNDNGMSSAYRSLHIDTCRRNPGYSDYPIPAGLPGLHCAGRVQPIGPTIPLVEIQARWLAGVLAGDIRLPGRKSMASEITRHRRMLERRYVGSRRSTLEVDFREYAAQIEGDRRRGRAGI